MLSMEMAARLGRIAGGQEGVAKLGLEARCGVIAMGGFRRLGGRMKRGPRSVDANASLLSAVRPVADSKVGPRRVPC